MSIDLSQLPEIKALNPKYKTFVLNYISNGKAIESYKKAGYSHKGADSGAYRLLKNKGICRAIQACESAVAKESDLTVEWISSQIQGIAQSETAKPQDRLRALELLGKYKGMFKEQSVNIAMFGDNLTNKMIDRMAGVASRLQTIDIKGLTSEGEVK